MHVALEIFYVQNFSRLLEKERARYENGVEEEWRDAGSNFLTR